MRAVPAVTETAKAAKTAALDLDVTVRGHGVLARFHDGCRCPWCMSTARERGCPCPECHGARTTGRYVYLPPVKVIAVPKDGQQ